MTWRTVLASCGLVFVAGAAWAGSISITTTQNARLDGKMLVVAVTIGNTGDEAAHAVTPLVRFGGKEARGKRVDALAPNASVQDTVSLDVGDLAPGTWTATDAERNGEPATDVVGHRLTFAGDSFRIVRPDGALVYGGSFRADPAAVPAGRYAKAWLQKRGVWASVEKRVVPTLNVRAALAAVAAGEADAGVVFVTDVRALPGVQIAFAVPVAEGPRIVYPAAAVTSKRSADAAKLLDFLASPEAAAIFERFGFTRPTP